MTEEQQNLMLQKTDDIKWLKANFKETPA